MLLFIRSEAGKRAQNELMWLSLAECLWERKYLLGWTVNWGGIAWFVGGETRCSSFFAMRVTHLCGRNCQQCSWGGYCYRNCHWWGYRAHRRWSRPSSVTSLQIEDVRTRATPEEYVSIKRLSGQPIWDGPFGSWIPKDDLNIYRNFLILVRSVRVTRAGAAMRDAWITNLI